MKKLDDICNDCFLWEVKKEAKIKPFVEEHGLNYEAGRGFYQLMKKELIQGYKRIVLREKTTGNIYIGDKTRDMLGLPAGDVKVGPGNHGNFDIFPESTSFTRILSRGTKFIYLK